ncbi:hypothetical protein BDZ94DRAFT_1282125 [Collybia nuda]|uniref:NAD(P)-binding protein n=1 Tax=Collybia nuda TaxID=64659 RepID=A0A9P5Y8S8_9AGAR|nr:hypothetical protein BDZ94DRAFT_1282125 [Collybia nuda]
MSQKSVWFVTGTSSGLGNALLHEILSSGNSIIATARNPESLQATLEQKYDAETLKRALIIKVDITQPNEIKAAFAAGLQKFGEINVVVNNAGYAVLSEIEECPMDLARIEFEIMFWGPVHISKEAIRVFREVNPPGKGGCIFNVSSTGGYSSQPLLSFYNAAKFAIEGFTESLRKEMSPEWNIQASAIEPGGFNTGWRDGLTILPPHPAYKADNSPTSQYRAMLRHIPFIGSPERAAKALLTLSGKKDLPLRIQLGSDAATLIRHTARKTIADSEKWEDIAHSTNIDGIDPPEYTKSLLAALG